MSFWTPVLWRGVEHKFFSCKTSEATKDDGFIMVGGRPVYGFLCEGKFVPGPLA